MTDSWDHVVSIGRRFTDESIPYVERRDHAVAVFRSTPDLPERDTLDELLAELATAPDAYAFDSIWPRVYAWADEHGVWIDVFSEPSP